MAKSCQSISLFILIGQVSRAVFRPPLHKISPVRTKLIKFFQDSIKNLYIYIKLHFNWNINSEKINSSRLFLCSSDQGKAPVILVTLLKHIQYWITAKGRTYVNEHHSNLSFGLFVAICLRMPTYVYIKKKVPLSIALRVNHFSTLSFTEQSQKHKYLFFLSRGLNTQDKEAKCLSEQETSCLLMGRLPKKSQRIVTGLQRDETMLAWQDSHTLIHMVWVNNSLSDIINQRGSTCDVSVQHLQRGELGRNRVGSEVMGGLVLLRL